MRTLPVSMQSAFNDQQGVQLHLIVEINWAGQGPIKYSTCEFTDTFAYIKDFSDFESVSHVEGFGSVSSMKIEFHDQFGHFKEIIDTLDIFNGTTATVYLTLDGIELFDLFEGELADSPGWKDKIFSIELVSKKLDKEVGYTPSIDDISELDPDYDFLSKNLNTQSWPSVFGSFKNYIAPIIFSQRLASIEEDAPYNTDPLPYYELKVDSIDNFTTDYTYTVNIVGKEQNAFSILGSGQFKADKTFQLTKAGVTSMWYQNIAFEFLPPDGISGANDEPLLRIEIDPGSVVLTTGTLNTLGPTGAPTSSVWLQFMRLEIKYTYIVGSSTITNTKYVNCTRQDGNICYLNEYFTLPAGSFNIYIKTVHKAKDIIYKIPKGSQIYIIGDQIGYIVDTKQGTTVDKVQIKNGENFITLDPSTYIVSSATLWQGTHPPVTYVYMYAEIYMRYLEFYAVQNKSNDGIYITASNNIATDSAVIENVSELSVIDSDPVAVNFAYFDVEQVVDIVPEIAWQTNKAVRTTRSNGQDVLELINLKSLLDPIFVFDKYNILKGSLTYGYSSSDKVYTKFKADFQTNDHEVPLKKLKYSKNIDKYGEVPLDVDYYIFNNINSAKESLEFWRDRLSKYYYTVSLTGFLDAFHLEIWDRVAIDLDETSFYNPIDGTPFNNTHSASPDKWYASGLIKSISPNLQEGIITFVIELDSISGDTTKPGFIIP